MHDDATSATPPPTAADVTTAPPPAAAPLPDLSQGPWWSGVTSYQWFVLAVAALGWLFDTMDQQLFNLARNPAMAQLLAADQDKTFYGGLATAIFLIGWGAGGLVFGVMGDRFGRVRTMLLTILIYSLCTGLSALSVGFWDFALYRFLTGLGVGGEFAVGVALVAEVFHDRARPHALGWLQSLSAVGNVAAALVTIGLAYVPLEYFQSVQVFGQELRPWRLMFVVGTVPALLTLLIMGRLREPEKWRAAVQSFDLRRRMGSLKELFGDPRWRRHALVGLMLAFAGVVGLWGIGFFSFDLQRVVFEPVLKDQGLSDADVSKTLYIWTGWTSVLLNLGGFAGIQAFMWLTHRTSRRMAFLISFPAAMASTAFTYFYMGKFAGVYDTLWMMPLMGFCQLSLFGGYAIYLPELFPTRLRSTGTSFCYNVGRIVAAAGPFTLGMLTSVVFKGYEEPMRYAGVTMCAVFVVGLLALPFAPETKGQPLPE
jgi:MFS family permease